MNKDLMKKKALGFVDEMRDSGLTFDEMAMTALMLAEACSSVLKNKDVKK